MFFQVRKLGLQLSDTAYKVLGSISSKGERRKTEEGRYREGRGEKKEERRGKREEEAEGQREVSGGKRSTGCEISFGGKRVLPYVIYFQSTSENYYVRYI